jgi:YidC/Oxa1 family membrane protein insertase
MNLFEMILFPFRWVVSAVLWVFHEMLTAIGMDPAAGITWVLCIVGLTLVMRTLTIPLFLKQIKSMRGMQELQPEMAKLQAKYKGKKDQLSRQAMAQEQMELYKSHGSNPFSACLPILVQMPIFFGLFQVLNGVPKSAAAGEGVHVLNAATVQSFNEATFFGAPLFSTLLNPGDGNHVATILLAVVMIIAMSASQFFTQKQLTAKNMSEAAKASPMYRQQQMMLYLFPLVFAIGGINFPIGVLIYWTTTNLWTMGQQFFVIRRMPTPGSPAAKALAERRAAKGLPALSILTGKKDDDADAAAAAAAVAQAKGQRTQPQRKNRKKK